MLFYITSLIKCVIVFPFSQLNIAAASCYFGNEPAQLCSRQPQLIIEEACENIGSITLDCAATGSSSIFRDSSNFRRARSMSSSSPLLPAFELNELSALKITFFNENFKNYQCEKFHRNWQMKRRGIFSRILSFIWFYFYLFGKWTK